MQNSLTHFYWLREGATMESLMKKQMIIALCILSFNLMVSAETLKIMSYNVRRMGSDPQEHQWDKRKELIREQITAQNPAIIGFQEVVDGEHFESLKNLLPEYKSFGTARKESTTSWLQQSIMNHPDAKNECNPIFYNPDKVKLIQSGTFGINPRGFLLQANLPRICTWGLFEDKETSKRFYIYNTHLSTSSMYGFKDGTESIRNKQMCMIFDEINKNKSELPVFIMGDFNTRIEGNIKKIINKNKFKHAKEIAQVAKGPKETRTGWSDKELKEIDHILVKNAQIKEYEVIQSAAGVYPSDHRPVMATVTLQ
jgi:endonuclease/exonuclease/phosphatase family metal-dependent hydrolase